MPRITVHSLVAALNTAHIPVLGVEFGDDSTDHEITITEHIAIQVATYAGGCCVNVYDGVGDDFGCAQSPMCANTVDVVESVKHAMRIVGECPSGTDRANWYGANIRYVE